MENASQVCDPIKKRFGADCFGVSTKFLPGCWFILTAAFLLFGVAQILSRITENVIADREMEALDENCTERKLPSGRLYSILGTKRAMGTV